LVNDSPSKSKAGARRKKRRVGSQLGQNKELRKLRATRIVHELLLPGATHKSVARKLQLSTQTIKREIAFASAEGILKNAQNVLANDLIPLSLALYKKHLELALAQAQKDPTSLPDLTAALEVLKGVHIFAGANQATIFEEEKKTTEVLTLSDYHEERDKLNAPKHEQTRRLALPPINDEEEPVDGVVLGRDDNQGQDDQRPRDGDSEQSGPTPETDSRSSGN